MKFYFRYVLNLAKPKTAALHVGSAVHAVLNAWNKARWINQPLSLKQLHEEYAKAWSNSSDGSVKWEDGEEEAQRMTGWRLCETYLRETNISPNTKPDAVEVPIEADLHEHGLPKLIGVLDLVQQRKIIDFKTSSTTPNPDKIGHSNEIQTASYAILYRHNTGKIEEGIELHHLVKLKSPKLVITPLPPMNEQRQSRLFRLMEGYVKGLEHRDFLPSPGMQCMSCEFFNECRAWK